MPRNYFENAQPVDDAMTVLDLLCPMWGDDTVRRVHLPRARKGFRFYHEPYLEICHVHDFGDDDVHTFRVTTRAAHELLDAKLVCGKKEWGYTDMHELKITDSGIHRLYAMRDRVGLPLDFRADEWIQTAPWGAAPPRMRAPK
jgi:hypothetical protein